MKRILVGPWVHLAFVSSLSQVAVVLAVAVAISITANVIAAILATVTAAATAAATAAYGHCCCHWSCRSTIREQTTTTTTELLLRTRDLYTTPSLQQQECVSSCGHSAATRSRYRLVCVCVFIVAIVAVVLAVAAAADVLLVAMKARFLSYGRSLCLREHSELGQAPDPLRPLHARIRSDTPGRSKTSPLTMRLSSDGEPVFSSKAVLLLRGEALERGRTHEM